MKENSKKIIHIGYGKVKPVSIGNNLPLVFIGGPCAIESRSHTLLLAESIHTICSKLNIPWIFKACYNKDCRSSLDSFHGVGLEKGLKILEEVRNTFLVPVVSDFSDASWAKPTAEVVDMIQVPAYFCRQTSILQAAGKTKRPVLLKKGQFMNPENMKNSIHKIKATGNDQILLTERGTFFGYHMLINDFRSLPYMKSLGYPVCYDATHSIQLPTAQKLSGGQREYIPNLVRAACGCGINALFIETHNNPEKALSDKNTVLDIKYLEMALSQAKEMHALQLQLSEKWEHIHVT